MADPRSPRSQRTEAKRARIVECAMRRFAEHGYQGAKIDAIAAELGIAKGSIFQHFGSKAGLFFTCYRQAVSSLPAWLDAPSQVQETGFFAVVDYWLERTEHLVREDLIPYRVVFIGDVGTDDLALKRDILRYLVSEDPYGTLDFIEFGIARGEVRDDVDIELVASLVDWWSGSLQDALVAEERDPGLFHRWRHQPDRQRERLRQFSQVLRSAIGTTAAGADAELAQATAH
jgi:AcrR family transcriptional regulator